MAATGNLEEAQNGADDAVRIATELVKDFPDFSDGIWVLGDAYEAQGMMHLSRQEVSKAQKSFHDCIQSWLILDRRRSGTAEFYASRLEQFCRAAALASGLSSEHRDEYWRLALDLADRRFPPGTDTDANRIESTLLLCKQTEGLVRVKELDVAMNNLVNWRKETSLPAVAFYNMACAHSLVFGALPTDDSRRGDFQQHAIRLLQAASDVGWRDGNHAAQDADLEPLRQLPEFERWLDSLKTKK